MGGGRILWFNVGRDNGPARSSCQLSCCCLSRQHRAVERLHKLELLCSLAVRFQTNIITSLSLRDPFMVKTVDLGDLTFLASSKML